MALPLDAEDGDDGDGPAFGRWDAAAEGVVGIVDVAAVVEAGTACDGLRGVLLGAMLCMQYVVVLRQRRGEPWPQRENEATRPRGWFALSSFSRGLALTGSIKLHHSNMLSVASTSAPRTALCSCLRRPSATAGLARAVHTRPNLPYDIRQGCRPFLSEKAIKGTAIEWHQGNLDRLNDLTRGEGQQARPAVCARVHTGNFGLAMRASRDRVDRRSTIDACFCYISRASCPPGASSWRSLALAPDPLSPTRRDTL